ncbi:Exocyst complex component 1 [Halotydeus destructor]|nr:Exocyst complex component 1 [Halotydeus destructor]
MSRISSARPSLNGEKPGNGAVFSVHTSDTDSGDDESYQALTSREESDLERLMEQCEFTIHNAEAFTEQLSREVASMDTMNIQTIMASEQKVESLMQILQTAVDETVRLESKIENYQSLLKNVRDTVFQVEKKEALVQTRTNNQDKLLEELEHLVKQLEYPPESEAILAEADLTSEDGIGLCIAAARDLEMALNASIHPALCQLGAVMEQQRHLQRLQYRFGQRVSSHITHIYQALIREYGDQIVRLINTGTNEPVLPNHSLFYSTLLLYTPLVKWLKTSHRTAYENVLSQYMTEMKRQYGKELRQFFEVVRDKLSGGRQGSTISSGDTNLSAGRLTARSRSSSVPGTSEHTFDTVSSKSSEISLSEWEEFDSWIDKMLSAIDPVCLAEQQFCLEFFDLGASGGVIQPRRTSAASANSNTGSSSPSMASKGSDADIKSSEQLRSMMNDLFAELQDEFRKFVCHYDKLDGIYSMYLMVRLSQHVLYAQDAGSFLSKIYGSTLIVVKRNFDEYMKQQQKSIEDAKVPKKPKCGVFPFIKKFENLAKQAENIFRKESARRADIDRWYVQLVRAMFESIDKLSSEHYKTPAEMVRVENYHFVHDVLRMLKISCLDDERKEAKNRYNAAIKDYVSRYFGRPLEKLNIFFEGVQQKVAQGVKEEEISYQLAFSKQELRKVIKECSLKEVKRGLEEMYRKVEKHAAEPDSTLIQVIWRSMQEEFISQYKAIQLMIERCYPDANLQLEFTIEDILNVFSEIARSH